MKPEFDFTLFKPKGRLLNEVQAIWSAKTSPQNVSHIQRWLNCDACSGIVFHFNGDIALNDTAYSPGVLLLPVSKQAQLISLPPGAELMGIRFHPAVSFGLLGSLYSRPTYLTLNREDAFNVDLYALYERLAKIAGQHGQIAALYRWLDKMIRSAHVLPDPLKHALKTIDKNCNGQLKLGMLNHSVPLSQRQTERQFQKWMSMTPKYYQRILRVKKAMHFLKYAAETSLANVAFEHGFTDQAHMTREFTHIAKVTPMEYRKRVT
ncbi:helix-turn-helix transcriptional regulator [uncultured Shewanella sp.]|uniref:helix-turn-helix transcriptional regulator n=1 Tax=uncultured Shewanella sp. TaxID=173975 RepID=UPI002611D869|nr:helix-turn-helix transcriptional regulator [uncultured Shewanella sp.]